MKETAFVNVFKGYNTCYKQFVGINIQIWTEWKLLMTFFTIFSMLI